jgi:mono/diheme cytochrome c family protein
MRVLAIVAVLTLTVPGPEQDRPAASAFDRNVRPFLVKHCMECHDGETRKGGLDLAALAVSLERRETFAQWAKVHDRIRDGEMPPPKKSALGDADRAALLSGLGSELSAADTARQKRDGRAAMRRLNRVELENSLRDLLFLPGFRIKEALPEDGKSHGFDRLSEALDLSFVHMESYLAAVDAALNAALCPLPEKPPVFKVRYRPWDNTRHGGKEAEGAFVGALGRREAIGLIGMKQDPTFEQKGFAVVDEEPKSNAIGLFRHEDADHLWTLTALAAVLPGVHKIRVSGYSFGWDGKEVVPTDRHGALSFGIFSTAEHFGTVDLPPNQAAERELTVWLERGGGMTHGTHDTLRLNPASCEKIRDFRHGKNKDVNGPLAAVPGVAIEWVEIEGPIYDQWPPASHRALFGDLPVKEWTKDCGVPKPRQQEWRRGNPGTMPKDPYGENGQKRPVVYVESKAPEADARQLLQGFLRRAFRRPVSESEMSRYVSQVARRLKEGSAFQDAMMAAYREALASPEFLLLQEVPGRLSDHALAQRLSYFLWSSLPDDELSLKADKGELGRPEVLRVQTERMLRDQKARRFVENFTGQWLALRDINATQPDTKLYPEFMPLLQEALVLETQGYFAELLGNDLGVSRFVKSDFALLNEPLARQYGIDGVRGWDLRKVALPEGSLRGGGFLTQGAVLKVTANGTTTSPVKRGAFVMEKIMGIVPTPPPPDAGAIEPDVRGAVTVRQQLDKHRANPTCAGCHQKMDGYGFALESFDVAGEWRTRYRATGGGENKRIHGRNVEYHYGLPVDCAGTMPDGRPFKDVLELRDLLAADPERLARAFAGHLLVYATGGELTFADRAKVADIVKRSAAKGFGVRTLIHEIVQSDPFRTK